MMRIAYKLHLTNLFAIVLIVVTGIYSFKNLNLVMAKLNFIEVADDLNASFLEMRINEKNYFLYHDDVVLKDLQNKLTSALTTMDQLKAVIIRATGAYNFELLQSSCKDYLRAVQTIKPHSRPDAETQTDFRQAGQKLREFSYRITGIERERTNRILMKSKRGLLTTLIVILISATTISYLFLFNILKSLKKIKSAAKTISEGKFYEMIETDIPHDEVGSVLKAINVMVSELKNREDQIIQSKKLASIGILTAGVAHELGNPLNNISMIAQTFQEHYANLTEAEHMEFMKMVEDESDRIKDIVTNLLDFSKPKEQIRAVIDINHIVKKGLRLVENLIHISNIDVTIDLREGLPPVLVNENRILEVLVNLMTNAIHAMSKGGQLTVFTDTAQDPGYVQIEITDNGKGIPPQIIQHLFDPFFSTKGTQGTGLGLFVSYGIIKNHGGTIDVDSQVSRGTKFTIILPATDTAGNKPGMV
jgi:two-component system, NtrC family, sensor kinase